MNPKSLIAIAAMSAMSSNAAASDSSGSGETQPGPTFGQKACGVSFNPGGNPDVDAIKRQYAALIDDLHNRRVVAQMDGQQEHARMLSIAITEAQTSQMWAVKAVTWRH